MGDEARRYAAFLSYSHKDSAAARWLHRRLETYRLPHRLVGTVGEHGPVARRLTPIFRDREELSAAGDLSERVRVALAASNHLVILCSPNSAASLWVAKEIELFRQLHPGRPIYAAVVDGEPGSCFPCGLAEGGAEPLAADLRPHRDGRRLGVLKLVAGLSGVDLDALVQRDAARRIRRVTAVTAVALAAMLAMAAMTSLALQARREAQRQRAGAEGLVEFMLTDLRDRLGGVGSLDAMSAVNARALRYYADRDVTRLPDESLARNARILQAIGEDDLELGDGKGALRASREAEQITQELVARSPHSLARLFEHSKSLDGIGRAYELLDDWANAQTYYSRFWAAARRLVARRPDDPDYIMKMGSAWLNLGNVQFAGLANFTSAQAHYERAERLFRRAAAAQPENPHARMAWANALAWLADSFFMQGLSGAVRDPSPLWRRSLAARLLQVSIMGKLHDGDPDNADYTYRLAVAEYGAARSLANLEERGPAAAHLFEADRLTDEVIRSDEKNRKKHADWLGFRLKLDRALLKLGLGLPPGMSRPQLRRRIEEVGKRLDALEQPAGASK